MSVIQAFYGSPLSHITKHSSTCICLFFLSRNKKLYNDYVDCSILEWLMKVFFLLLYDYYVGCYSRAFFNK